MALIVASTEILVSVAQSSKCMSKVHISLINIWRANVLLAPPPLSPFCFYYYCYYYTILLLYLLFYFL